MSISFRSSTPPNDTGYADISGTPIYYEEWAALQLNFRYKLVSQSRISDFIIETQWRGRTYLKSGMFATVIYCAAIKYKWNGAVGCLPLITYHHPTKEKAERAHAEIVMNIIIKIYKQTLDLGERVTHYEERRLNQIMEERGSAFRKISHK